MAGAAESRSRGSGSREGRADPREEVEPTRESAPGPLSVSTGSAPHQRHNRTSSSSSTTTTKPSTSTPQTDDRLPVPTRSGLPTITKPPLFAPRSSSRQAFDSTQATPPLHFDHGRSNSTGRPGRNPYPSYNPFFSNLWDLPPRPSGPTSLPPPPRSPAGSIGRRRAEDLRRAGQVSDLELPGSSGAATSRTSRAGSIGRKQESATGLASFGETITGAVATSDKRTGPAEAPLGSHQVSRSQQPRQHHVPRLPPSHLPALARKPGSILRDSYRVPNDASTVEVQAAQDRSRSSRLRYAAPPIVEQRKQDRDSGLFSSAPRLSVHGDLEQDDITPSGVQPGPSPSRTTRATKGRRSSLLLSFSSSGSSTPETTNPKRFSSILRPSRPIKTAEQPSTEPRSDLEEQQSQFKHSKRNSFVERSLALLTPRKSKIRQRQDARAESAQQSSESNAAAVEEIRSAAAAEPGVGEPRTDEPLEHKLPSSDPISVSRIPIAPRPQSALGSTSAESRRADQSTAAADISGSLIPSRVDSNTKPVRPSTASAAMPTAQSAATIGTAAPSRRMSVSDNAGSRFTQHTWTGPGRATLSNAPSTRSRVDSASASSPPSSAGAALALASSTSAGGTGPRSGIPRPVRSPEQPSSSPEISHKPLPRAPATNRASILDHTHATNASLNLRLADPQRGIIGVAANEEVEPELSGFPKKQCAAGSESGASGRKVGGLDEVVRNAEGESAKDQRKETTERILPEQRR